MTTRPERSTRRRALRACAGLGVVVAGASLVTHPGGAAARPVAAHQAAARVAARQATARLVAARQLAARPAAPQPPATWSPARVIEPGEDPKVAFGPTGIVAVVSEQTAHRDRSEAALAVSRGPRGGFAAPTETGPVGPGGVGLGLSLAVAVARDGTTVVGFQSPTRQGEGVRALVRAPHASHFGPPQVLLGNSAAGGYGGSAFLSTSRGEIVEFGFDQSQARSATLAPGRLRFDVRRAAVRTSEQFGGLAADDAGDTALAYVDGGGCTAVAQRAPFGEFRRTFHSHTCGSFGEVPVGLVAAGDGDEALFTEDSARGDAPGGASRLAVRVGRFGAFGRAQTLTEHGFALDETGQSSGDNVLTTTPSGVAISDDGALTAGWRGCGPRSCVTRGIYARTGTVTGGLDGPTTLLARARRGVREQALMTDGAVAYSTRARRRPATISVATEIGPTGAFGPAQVITAAGGRLLGLVSDGRGDLLLTYSDARGAIYATVMSAAGARFASPHRLTPPGVNPASVTSAYGPRGVAIVAWSRGHRTSAALYAG